MRIIHYSNNNFLQILGNEKCDVFVKYVDHYNLSPEEHVGNENDGSDEAEEDNRFDGKQIREDTRGGYYKIIDNTFLCSLRIIRNSILDMIVNHKDMVQKIMALPKEIENCRMACSRSGGCSLIEYLIENDDTLMENVEKIEGEFCKIAMAKKGSYEHCLT